MSGYCDRCGNTLCVCAEYEAQTADYVAGEIIGVDFTDRADGTIVLLVAVPEATRVRREPVHITPAPNDGSG